MNVILKILHPMLWTAVTVAFHVMAMLREMFAWESMSEGLLGFTPAQAKLTEAMAANQGIYNGFIAVGLILTFVPALSAEQRGILRVYLLICAMVAGIFGTVTIALPVWPDLKTLAIFAAQWVPPVLAMAGLLLRRRAG